jgi:ribonuclease R
MSGDTGGAGSVKGDPELVRRVMSYLREEAGHPMKPGELARGLDVADRDYDAFLATLEELQETGMIYRQRKGRFAVPEKLNLVIGPLSVTRGGDGFVGTGPDQEDVFIPERHLGTAVAEDVVVARIEKRPSGKNPEGRIIKVFRRAWSQVVGIYHRKRSYGFVVPQEPDLHCDFFIPPGKEAEAEDGQMVVVEVVDWGDEGPSPVGRVAEVLGWPDEAGVDVLSIIHGHGLPLEFPDEIEEAARQVSERGIREEDLQGREDFRDRLVFTIDPPDAKDFDDALSVERLEDGGFRVGVHIADVSHYVPEGSALDREARERATSVYLVDRVVPMLPEELSGNLCSLRPEEERLAMSVVFTMDEDGRVEAYRFARTVIRSDRRLTYDEAHDLAHGNADGPEELVEAIRILLELSKGIRRRREDRGSIDFDLPESRVVLNTAGEPTDIQRVLRLDTHRMIEDLMIQANEAVAQAAEEEEYPSLFRIHEEPAEDKVENLRELAATFGHTLPSRRIRPKDLAELVDAMDGTPQEQLISTATLRSMKKAIYSVENRGHFGLASPAYTHFTSPIRRYPDLLVHRQLERWVLEEDEREESPERRREELAAMAEHCSERERRAVEAERDSVDLKKIEFMERHVNDEFQGTISGVTAFGFFVLLDEYHVEGLVHVSTLEDDYYVFFEDQHALIGQRKRRKFQLGNRVRVQVTRVDREARQIDFELKGGGA